MDEFDTTNDSEKEWQVIKIDDKEYLLKSYQDHDVWKVILTKVVHLWIEELSLEMLMDRCTKLNPALDVESFDAKKCMIYLLRNIPTYSTAVSLNGIELSKVIRGGVFKFRVKFKKGSPEQLWEEVTSKLCQSIAVLLRRNHFLIDVIQKKDREILEYKLEGARLIRKNIETEEFNEKMLDEVSFEDSFSTLPMKTVKNVIDLSRFLRVKKESCIREKTDASESKKSTENEAQTSNVLSSDVSLESAHPSKIKVEDDDAEMNEIQQRFIINDTNKRSSRRVSSADVQISLKKLRKSRD